jgi:hypothetical protein
MTVGPARAKPKEAIHARTTALHPSEPIDRLGRRGQRRRTTDRPDRRGLHQWEWLPALTDVRRGARETSVHEVTAYDDDGHRSHLPESSPTA